MEKTGGRAGGGRDSDVDILFGRTRTEKARGTAHVRCCGGKERPDQDGLIMTRGGTENGLVEGC